MKMYPNTHLSLTITFAVLASLQSCSANLMHLKNHENCIHIRKCEPVMRLLSNQIIKSVIYGFVRDAVCGFEGNEPKILCDVQRIIPNYEQIQAFFIISMEEFTQSSTTTTTAAPIKTTARPYRESYDKAEVGFSKSYKKCVHIMKCRSIARLLEKPITKSRTYNRIREAICGFEGFETKIYCDPQQIITEDLENTDNTLHSTSERPIPIPSIIDMLLKEYFYYMRKYGECMKISKCISVVKLINDPNTKWTIHNYIRDTVCDFDGIEAKIYCDIQRSRLQILRSTPAPISTTTTLTTETIEQLAKPLKYHPYFKLLEHEICGPVPVQTRIYGGTEAELREFPWMALLSYEIDGVKGFHCGATIVNENHVLTAAHCVSHLPSQYKFTGVRVGEYNLAKEWDCETDDDGVEFNCNEKYQNFEAEEIFVHPEFSMDTLSNDIAVIRLNGIIDFESSNVRPICLPIDRELNLVGKTGIVSGWGATEDGSPASKVLLKVELPILSRETCLRAYRDQPHVNLYKQICAGGITKKDACTGDSGGPLQMVMPYGGEQRTVQLGIVSFGRKTCGLRGVPGVYTNVVHYVDWILDRLGERGPVRLKDFINVY